MKRNAGKLEWETQVNFQCILYEERSVCHKRQRAISDNIIYCIFWLSITYYLGEHYNTLVYSNSIPIMISIEQRQPIKLRFQNILWKKHI